MNKKVHKTSIELWNTNRDKISIKPVVIFDCFHHRLIVNSIQWDSGMADIRVLSWRMVTPNGYIAYI